jgi:prepilin-type N-terminal cleavage/methylation domain-containing protein
MTNKRVIQSGFTLIELLVVVTVLGLLAIAVMPAFTAGGDRRLLLGTAERLDTHLKHAAARATGKPRGAGVLLQADVGGVAALDIEFVRVSAGRVMTGDLEPFLVFGNPSPTQRRITVTVTDAVSNGGFSTADEGALLQIGSSQAEFKIEMVGFPAEPTEHSFATIAFPPGQTPYNSLFPANANGINFVVYPPPSGPEITKRPTVFPNQACVDLSASTIGVYGYGEFAGGGAPATLSQYTGGFVICFDVYGKAHEAWGFTPGLAAERIQLTPGKPIALLSTLAFQAGKSFVSDYSTITDSNPGAGYQNPDAFWVVIDPKTGRSFIVENSFEPSNLAEAQTFVRDDLMGN